MPFNWNFIGNYPKGLIWGKDRANDLKENVSFLLEALQQWHDVDTAQVGDFAGQGFSKQIRSVTHACGGVLSADDYGAHILHFAFNRQAHISEARSYLLDNSIDFRNRIIWAFAVQLAASSLPTETYDSTNGFSYNIDDDADVNPTTRASLSSKTNHLGMGMSYTESGSAFDTIIGGSNRSIRVMPSQDVHIHASSNAGTTLFGETIAIGNLLVTLESDAAEDNHSVYGIIYVSPQFATP